MWQGKCLYRYFFSLLYVSIVLEIRYVAHHFFFSYHVFFFLATSSSFGGASRNSQSYRKGKL